MTDLKERLHQIACCEGECMENRIEAWERIAELEAALKDEKKKRKSLKRYWKKGHLEMLERAEKAEAQLDAVRKIKPFVLGDDRTFAVYYDELQAALNGEGK